MNTVVQILDTLEDAARGAGTDGALIDRFVRLRDPEAFACVVRRHGPMVLGVCRRVLRNRADADDAFQAAFLVLARKAATLTTPDQLGPWLHGVAYNTARRLRRTTSRRTARESPLEAVPEPHAAAPAARDELLGALDEELDRLPERYRAVVVLCDLEGLTRRAAARALACPEGTVAGRLARARGMLAARLARRGVVPAAGLLVAVLTTRATGLAPVGLAGLVRVASAPDLTRAVSQGLISSRVADTTRGVLKAMTAARLRTAAFAMCLGLALACAGGAWHFANAQPALPAADAPRAAETSGPPPAPADAGKRLASVIPLKKLDAKQAATKLAKLLPESVTVAAVRDENALVVYATEKGTDDVRLVLRTLGEELPKVAVRKTPAAQKYPFRFKGASWDDVLDAYANLSGLTLITTVKPTGKVTIDPAPGREYTLGEITDIINEALAQQKFILIRRRTTFFLHPADEKLEDVPRRFEEIDLAERSRSEIVEVILPLEGVAVEDVRDELKQMLTPFGVLVALKKQNVILIRDTVGSIERIQLLIQRLGATPKPDAKPAAPDKPGATIVQTYTVPPGSTTEVAKALQTEFPRAHVIPLSHQNQILVIATPDEHQRIDKLLRVGPEWPLAPKFVAPPRLLPAPELAAPPKKYTLRFEQVPWADLFVWYGKVSGLTHTGTTLPEGTFSFAPPKPERQYTLGEVTDVINDALMKQKRLLVRGETSFTVVSAGEKIGPAFIPHVEIDDLTNRGRTELVSVYVELDPEAGAAIEPTVQELMGPFGRANWYPLANALMLRDTVENFRTIYPTVKTLEQYRLHDRKLRKDEADKLPLAK